MTGSRHQPVAEMRPFGSYPAGRIIRTGWRLMETRNRVVEYLGRKLITRYVKNLGSAVDLIKIDVEGYEDRALDIVAQIKSCGYTVSYESPSDILLSRDA